MASLASIANDTIKSSSNKRELVNSFGNTNDIINEILSIDKISQKDTKEFTSHLKGANIIDTARNDWRFVRSNIKYKLDPLNYQYLKTPARTWHDKYGDCKSYAIFLCSLLKNQGIKCLYRFVSFSNTPDYTHVYVIALDENNKYIYLDACLPDFNTQKKFNYNKDVMTKIYKLSGVGSSLTSLIKNSVVKIPAAGLQPSLVPKATANVKTVQNAGLTVTSVNSSGQPLVAKQIDFGPKDVQDLTEAEFLLYLAKDRALSKQQNAAKILGIGSLIVEKYQDTIDTIDDALKMVTAHAAGKLSNTDLEQHLDLIAQDAVSGVYSNARKISGIGSLQQKQALRKQLANERYVARIGKFGLKSITKFVKTNVKSAAKDVAKAATVVAQTTVHALKEIAKIAVKAGSFVLKVLTFPEREFIKGLIEVGLPQSAPFFLYLFITNKDTLSKCPQVVKDKRAKANEIKGFVVNFVGMKESHFMGIVRNGIIKHLGDEPEKILAKSVKGSLTGIGASQLTQVLAAGGSGAAGGAAAGPWGAAAGALIAIVQKLFSFIGGKKPSATANDAPNPGKDFAGSGVEPADFKNTDGTYGASHTITPGTSFPGESTGGSFWDSLKSKSKVPVKTTVPVKNTASNTSSQSTLVKDASGKLEKAGTDYLTDLLKPSASTENNSIPLPDESSSNDNIVYPNQDNADPSSQLNIDPTSTMYDVSGLR